MFTILSDATLVSAPSSPGNLSSKTLVEGSSSENNINQHTSPTATTSQCPPSEETAKRAVEHQPAPSVSVKVIERVKSEETDGKINSELQTIIICFVCLQNHQSQRLYTPPAIEHRVVPHVLLQLRVQFIR